VSGTTVCYERHIIGLYKMEGSTPLDAEEVLGDCIEGDKIHNVEGTDVWPKEKKKEWKK
jgi:hypothetical protein